MWGAADHGALGVNLQLKKGRSPISYLQKPVRTHFAEQHKVSLAADLIPSQEGLCSTELLSIR